MTIFCSNDIQFINCNNEILTFCENNFKLSNPNYIKMLRLNKSVYNIPKFLYLYKKVGDNVIIPRGLYNIIKSNFNLSLYETIFDLAPNYNFTPINISSELYAYQVNAMNILVKSKNGILVAPTGSGKTQIAIGYILKMGLRCLWITHTIDLLKQSYNRASQYIAKSQLGIISAGKVHIGSAITFATIQTLSKLDSNALKYEFNIIIVDECHRVAGTPTKFQMFYKVINSLASQYKFGLTATLHRSDGLERTTTSLLGDIVHNIDFKNVACKLVRPTVKSINTNIKLNQTCFDDFGLLDYNKLLTYLSSCTERNELIIKHILSNRENSNLILANRIDILQNLYNMLPDDEKSKGIVFTSKLSKKIRGESLELMCDGTYKYMFATFSLAKEGLDIPILDRLYLVNSSKDKAVITQSIGRIMRQYNSKTESIIFDFIDDYKKAKRDSITRRAYYKNQNCIF